ncbi:hypothetical protein HS088_TW19G00812 [Tripterygium wilfordii]|uniref:F-box domain-containing protein n=1 Tax=Tripterygium wilfordii TaxID=458696 RepID=A0A7J7CBG7_TRIWF|nr:F-box protein At5g52880 [Tripterygium wilfordii]KAF5731207.1 hypothetical protein HS088_TW19G00812 [Tripterygium wilfordii]
MSIALHSYQKLGLREALLRIHRYPIACKELSLILRVAYNKLPKDLQCLVFQDTLAAFHLLPEMQASNAVFAAHLLFQSAKASLPKQKRNLAVAEFKQAMISHKRRSKAKREEKDTAQLPEDVIIHIFSLLDLQSLVSVGQVCWLWNSAASDNNLWKSQYDVFFGNSEGCSTAKGQQRDRMVVAKLFTNSMDDATTGTSINWKETFKRAYIGNSREKFTSNRGYCSRCNAIVWVNNMKCSRERSGSQADNHKIKPLSSRQVAEYLIGISFSITSSSDSDSESDDEPISGLWAYPRHTRLLHKYLL